MNLDFFTPSDLRENLLRANIDFDGGTFYARLMRPQYLFNATHYQQLLNITATTGSIDYYVVASTRTVVRATGSFITNGFVVGNHITFSGGSANTGLYIVRAVAADGLSMRLDNVTAPALVSEGSPYIDVAPPGAGAEDTALAYVNNIISCEDEYPDATDGYTRGGVAVTFTISGAKLTLDPFNLSSFGAAALALSPGIIIYVDALTGPDYIVAYGRLSDWEVAF